MRAAWLLAGLLAGGAASAAVDLRVDLVDPADFTPGTTESWTLEVGNDGTTTNSPRLTTNFPAATTITWTCAASGTGSSCDNASGSGNLDHSGDVLAENGEVNYSFSVAFPANFTTTPLLVNASADENGATIGGVTDDDTSTPIALRNDIGIAKTAASAVYAPGGGNVFTLVVSNAGPSNAVSVDVADAAPAGMTFGTWTCVRSTGSCTTATGSGNLAQTINIPVGITYTYSIPVTFTAGASGATLTNTATVTADTGTDTESGNDSSGVTLSRDPRADFTLAFTPSTGLAYVPGSSGNTLSLRVRNPTTVNDVVAGVSLDFPATVSAAWDCVQNGLCSPDNGSGDFVTSVTLDAGQHVDVTFTLGHDSGALDPTLQLTAVVDVDGRPGPELPNDPADVRASVSYSINRQADVSIVKTAPAVASPGGAFTYELLVTNHGPSDVGNGAGETGIQVDDTFSPLLRGNPQVCTADPTRPCWRYCRSDNGSVDQVTPTDCPLAGDVISGSGHLADLPLELRSGSSSRILVFVSTELSTRGTVSNTASVALAPTTPAIGELVSGNNQDSVDVDIEPTTDIVVQKSSGVAAAAAGTVITYTITVTNQGFESANAVTVVDSLPLFGASETAGLVAGSISWQCRASGDACCTHDGAASTCGTTTPTPPVTNDVLTSVVDLPNRNSSVTYTVTGTIAPSASGTLENTATATLPPGLSDTDPSNNSDTDSTPIGSEAQLSLSKTVLSLTPATPPFVLTYELIAANAGPSRVENASVTDPLGDPQLLPASATWSCAAIDNPAATQCDQPSGNGPLNTTVDLDAGGRVRFEIRVPVAGTTGQITNTATLTAGTVTRTASAVTNLAGTGNLRVVKREAQGLTDAIPGTDIEYVVTVSNDGPDDALGAPLLDRLPAGLENVSWSCAATTPVPGDLASFMRTGGTIGGNALASSSDGRHVYVVSEGGSAVSAYARINVPGLGFGNVQALETEIEGLNDAQDVGGAVSGLQRPRDVALAPDGSMLYVLSRADGPKPASIASFNRVTNALDVAHGELSFAGSATVGGTGFVPARLVVGSGNLYVSGVDGDGVATVVVFRRSAATGLPLHDVDVTANVPSAPGAMVLAAELPALFVASGDAAGGSRVARFHVDAANGPTPAGRLSFETSVADATLGGIVDLAWVPAQRHLYALAAGSERLARLDALSGLSTATAQNATELLLPAPLARPFLGDVRIAVAADGEHLLLTNAGSAPSTVALIQFRRDTLSGGLAYEASFAGAQAPGIAGASDVAVTPDGRHVLVSSSRTGAGEAQLAVYTRRAPDPLFGFLELERQGDGDGSVTGLQAPSDVAASPDGQHVYVSSLAEGAIAVFRRDARSGAETAGDHLVHVVSYVEGQGGITGIARASRLLVSPDGKYVYVSSEDNNRVTAFARDDVAASPDFGRLTKVATLQDGVGGVDGLLGAQGMAMDDASTTLYVAGSFEASIAAFRREAGGALTYLGLVRAGSGGAVGLNGIRDLVVSGDGAHVMGVSSLSNAVVVLRRTTAIGPDYGRIQFQQSRTLTGVRLMSIAIPSTRTDPDDSEHVYVVGQDDSSLIVLKRVADPASTGYGTVSTLFEYRGLAGLEGPRDVALSADGRRAYVASQFGSSVLILDRDLNRSSQNFGALSPVEVRVDGADGVDGIGGLYALAPSGDSRHVYVAGFNDRALASFAIGSGSYCSAAGGGDIDDVVNIGAGGTLEYRVRASIRADATAPLVNTACVDLPDRFTDPDPSDNCSTWTSNLTPRGDLAITKSDGRVSATAGETIRYEVRVTNAGPSNLVHDASHPLTVTDLLDGNPGFVTGSARWTCSASGSGALDFVETTFDGAAPADRLAGVSDVVVLADSDGAGPLPGTLASASVLDDAITLFSRDEADGRLVARVTAVQGLALGAATIDSLAGVRALAASADGRFLYAASRTSDALSVFAIEDAGAGVPTLRLVEVQRNRVGLDQATHLALDGGDRFVYVAGANDDAIAVFQRNAVDGRLTFVESEQQGVDDATDAGGIVLGLDGVEFLVASPDGEHLYALSGSGASVARFERDGVSGRLTWREVRGEDDFGIALDGAAAAVFDADGEHLYLAAADSNRVLVLARRNQPSAGDFGELTLRSSVTHGDGDSLGLLSPRRLLLSADDAHLYVTAQSGSSVAWFARDPDDGSLGYLGQRSIDSADVDGLRGATGLALDPALDQLYVAGTLDASIAQFARQSDSSCPPSGSGELDHIPVDIAAGGSLRFLIDVEVSSTLEDPLSNEARVDSAPGVDTNPDNDVATDVDEPSLVADLRIRKDDGLAAYDGLAGARAIVATDDHVYAAGADEGAIGRFDRDADDAGADYGALHFAGVTRSGVDGVLGLNGVADLVLSPDATHLYAAGASDSSVAVFARDAGSGALAFVEEQRNGVLGVTGLSGARALATSADGRHLYVGAEFANAVAAFARQADPLLANHGRLTFIGMLQQGVGGVDGLSQPSALAVAPDGQHVYALSGNGNALAALRRNPNPGSGGFGQLSFLRRYLGNVGGNSGLEGGRSLAFAGDTHLYVLGATPGTLAHFVRTPATGELVLDQLLDADDAGGAALAGASRVRVAPGGAQLYVAGGDDAISRFDVGGDGRLTFASRIADGDALAGGGQVLGLRGARDVAIVPDGAHAYSVAADDDALAGFDRDAGGVLAYRESFFDGLGGVAPGASVQYRIEVANDGPAAVAQARVVDTFPPEFVSASWTCVEQLGNAQCVPSGTGNLDTIVELPAGSSLVFLATGVLGDAVGGTLVNTATVSADGIADPDTGDNSATDGDTVLTPALDLRAEVTSVGGSIVPGSDIQYAVRVHNFGPTYASAARIVERLPAAMLDVTWSCDATPVAGVLDLRQSLGAPPGSSQVEFTALAPSALGLHFYASATVDGVGALLVYARDPLDGTLALLEVHRDGVAGVGGLGGAADVVLAADQRHVYVAGADADAIAVFARDPAAGTLSYVTRYQDGELGVDGLGGVRRLLLAPGGSHLYAAGAVDDAIAVFAVQAASGVLTPASILRQSDPGMNGLNGVRDLAFDAGAARLYAIARDNRSLAVFTRNAISGALVRSALLEDFELGADRALLDPVALELRDARLFVVSAGNGRVSEFAFDAAEATLARVGDALTGLVDPADAHFEADQARLYVAERGAGRLRLYSLLGSTPGALADYPLGAVQTLAAAPDARQLYGGGAVLATFARERGSRCPLAGSGAPGGQDVDIAPGGWLDYVFDGTLFPNAVGTLAFELEAQPRELGSELDPSDNVAADSRTLLPAPTLSASKSDGRTEVVAGLPNSYAISVGNGGVSAAVGARVLDAAPLWPAAPAGLLAGSGSWTCAVAPALEIVSTQLAVDIPALQGMGRSALSPDGTRLYAVHAERDALLVFPRATDGSLGAPLQISDGDLLGGTTVSGLAGASAVAVSADGRHVLVTGAESNSLVVLSYAAGSHGFVQKLTSGSGNVVGLLGPVDVVFAARDRRVYVASPGADSIAVFSRDADTGLLAFVERVRDGFGTITPDSDVIRGVRRLHASEDGRHLYAVANGSQTISSFARDASSGALTYLGVLRRDAVPALAGARELHAAPGEKHLYVLGGSAIVRLERQVDGRLLAAESLSALPGLQQPRELFGDRTGARVYLVDAGGSISVFARDWSSGVLAWRQQVSPVTPQQTGAASALLVADRDELVVQVAAPGRLQRYAQRPLSHCHAASASADAIDGLVDLDVGGSAALSFSARVHPSARGVLSNQVGVTPMVGSDPGATPGVAQDDTTIVVVSDLSVQKTAPAEAVAGAQTSWQITVDNAGPSDALGIRVVDTLPAALRDVQWTCVATGTSSCPASGTTTLDLTATLHVGDQLQIAVQGRIDPAFTGALLNSVALVPEAGASDPTPGDHGDATTTDVVAEVDLTVAKSDGVARVVAGTTTTYTIDVTNAGPSDAPAVTITDAQPAGIEGATWICGAGGGASCPGAGSGDIGFSAVLPVGGTLTIVVTAPVADHARGQIDNVVSASVGGVVTETAPADNSARDIDQIDVVADLALDLVDALDPFDPASSQPLAYDVDVFNAGPSAANGIALDVDFSNPVTFVVPAGCTYSQQQLLCDLGTVGGGEHRVLTLQLAGLPQQSPQFAAQGSVASADPDPNPANNVASETTELRRGVDVAVAITRVGALVTGEPVRYDMVVRNVASLHAVGFVVDAPVAAGLLGASWTCTATGGATCTAAGSGAVLDTINVPPGATLTYRLVATVDATLDPTVPQFIEQSIEVSVPGGPDLNPANDRASDRAQVLSGIFRDGFESPPPARAAGKEQLR